MIEGFIVVVITLLFWGKVSKDTLESHPKLDVIKTIIYFTLSVIVAIIYYKSSQVEYSTNYVEIRKYFNTTNERNECSDSVSVVVNHRMNPENIRYLTMFENFNSVGGLQLTFKSKRSYHNLSIDSTKLKNIYLFLYNCLVTPEFADSIPKNNCLNGIINRYKVELYQYRPILAELQKKFDKPSGTLLKEDSTELINALKYIFEDQKSLYFITYIPPKRNTFLPIDIYKDSTLSFLKEDSISNDSYAFRYKSLIKEHIEPVWVNKGIDKETIKKELDVNNLTAYQYYLGSSDHRNKNYVPHTTDSITFLQLFSNDSLVNYIDYFTASDISQRIFRVSFFSDIPLKSLHITFDEPIYISELYPNPDMVTMNQILYTDRKKLDYLRTRSLTFHAKLPTFENKQLLRSLVLTTILTAVFSLFCTNLYLCGRGLIRRFVKDKEITDSEKTKYKKRISIFKWTLYSIIFVISALPILLYYLNLTNNTLLVKSDDFISLIWKVIVAIVVLIAALKIWKILLIPKDKKDKINEENLHT